MPGPEFILGCKVKSSRNLDLNCNVLQCETEQVCVRRVIHCGGRTRTLKQQMLGPIQDTMGAKVAGMTAGALLSRRDFCEAAGACLLMAAVAGSEFARPQDWKKKRAETFDVAAIDRNRILKAAERYLQGSPITVTASGSSRSAGGKHDYFSEGDYWWPDPKNPDGPYIQRDGMSNPSNFAEHRRFLTRLSLQVPTLTAAWRITGEQRYAAHAARHLRAWFVEQATRMNPNLQYAQAIHGRVTGRGTGIIDTIHLVEVARAIEVLEGSTALSKTEVDGIKKWFADYLQWMTAHPYGIEEREAKNNHGTCWVMQAAAFARLTRNHDLTAYTRNRFKAVLIPGQMASDGSFPLEMKRTKPYSYSLFNLDAMTTICQILSMPQDSLWTFELPDGRGMRKALAFMVPHIRNKKSWPLPPDVMYDKEWPMRHCALLFAGLAFDCPDYIDLWKKLPADSNIEEVTRNFFIRQPVLWVGTKNQAT